MAKGLIIAAPGSNNGKTFITLGTLRALKRRGIAVASAKVGPDYIDPAFHKFATSSPCPNLDSWAMRDETLTSVLQQTSQDTDVIVCEGVMGLFDGATLPPDNLEESDGSPADLARRTGWPVVLVIDANAQAASAAALIHGFATFDPDVNVTGVIFNKIGGPGHIELLKNACTKHIPHIKVLGFVPRENDLTLPERHLGLVLAEEHPELESFLEHSADFMEHHIDLDGLAALAGTSLNPKSNETNAFFPPLGQRIAIAKDKAFAFTYSALLDHWQAQGAELSFFSPLADETPKSDCDAIYMPGGYPELNAAKLSANQNFMDSLRRHHGKGTVLFGECGGYMTLGKTLEDADGNLHEMAGLLELETSFAKRKLHLGYRDFTLLQDMPFGPTGTRMRGHEFHYASILSEKGDRLFDCQTAAGRKLGPQGLRNGSCFGSFMHLIDQK